MKAVIFEKYGVPEEVLEIKEVAKPTPKENEVLVKIHATTINDFDWSLVRGKPYLYRLMFGIFNPKKFIAGMELSGLVEETGSKVQGLKVGDAVFGDISGYGFGTFAEYLCINEKAVIKKPDDISFEEAAAIPHAAALALQALRDIGKIGPGQKVLINGGGGGVGTIGLQLAKLHDCVVTGVDSGEKLEMMKSIGYDFVIDYKKIIFTKNGEEYDLILDCKSNRSAFSLLGSLKPKGKYVSIGGELGSIFNILFWNKIISLFSDKKLHILGLKSNKDLDYICQLITQNKIKCKIDGPYSIEDIPGLIQYFGDGKHSGKIVIKTS